MSDTVEILLATYNGEKFLPEQLESILNQTHKNIKVIICDDGSTDNTNKIIEEYIKKHKNIFRRIEKSSEEIRGAKESFGALIRSSTENYAMFCDQDDVWLPNKIEATLARMKHEEKKSGNETPILIHTDLLVVDEKLSIINHSFFKSQKIENNNQTIASAIIKNNVTGCTAMINKALINMIGKIPSAAIMHDWWLLLLGLTFGKILLVNEPLIKYRQHGKNTLGAKKEGLKGFASQIKKIWREINTKGNPIKKYINQSDEFFRLYSNAMPVEKKEEFKRIKHALNEKSAIKRMINLYNIGFKKSTIIGNIGLYIFIFFYNARH